MMVLSWLGINFKQKELHESLNGMSSSLAYLITGGATVDMSFQGTPLHIDAGSLVALSGESTARKHYFCDWILGYVDVQGQTLEIQVGKTQITKSGDRAQCGALMGRSPLLYGDTVQESLLYRTHHVRKSDLFYFIERLYGPSLQAKTMPESPLLKRDGTPLLTESLTAREHLEIAQINLILMKSPLVILDFSSDLMKDAIDQGFRLAPELLDSGKTILVLLPPGGTEFAEKILGRKFTALLDFA